MGNSSSKSSVLIADNPNRVAFVTFKSMKTVPSTVYGNVVLFTFTIRYLRYKWDFELRFNDIVSMEKMLLAKFGERLVDVSRPSKSNRMFRTHDQAFLLERSKIMEKYIQQLVDKDFVLGFDKAQRLLNISAASFNPDMGRKGKEGYMRKCSGGYVEKFSRKAGDYFSMWIWRWVVLHDTCISWYKSPDDKVPRGTLQLDRDFQVQIAGRILTICTGTRRLLLQAYTDRSAEEWATELREFYCNTSRTTIHFFESAFPPRKQCDVKVYTYTRDYYSSVAIAMLEAQKEILITSWKISPTVILSRPPYPPLRLDQILKYKADQGIKIFLLIYKEVDYVGQGNESLKAKTYLESLSPNIRCIRHPNKFMGGSTAVLWSHHEKTVTIDR